MTYAEDTDVDSAMAKVGKSLVAPIGDKRMAGRYDSGCGQKKGGINSEIYCVVMARMVVKTHFAGMVVSEVATMAREAFFPGW